jgi:hypothetical protein
MSVSREASEVTTADYPRQPAVASPDTRARVATEPAQQLAEALSALRVDSNSDECNAILTGIASDPLALVHLSDPGRFSVSDAVILAQRLQSIDPMCEVKLLRLLTPGAAAHHVADPWQASRVLEIVARITDGKRTLPLLSNLARHPDSRVRSKAILLIGRINGSLRWVQQQIEDRDPRVRANAVESLWGMQGNDAQRVFLTAVRDPAHRVAANGAVGLYKCGDLSCVRLLEAMARHEDPKFQAAAIWAMGCTEDPRFQPVLVRTAEQVTGALRQNALRAMVRIRDRLARLDRRPPLQVNAAIDGPFLHVKVRHDDGRLMSDLEPTNFVVSEQDVMREIEAVTYHGQSGGDRQSGAVRFAGPYYSILLRGDPPAAVEVNVFTEFGKGKTTASLGAAPEA